MRRKCANLATVGATAATDTMRRSMFREIHTTDEAVDGDADSPTDGAVVACLMFPSMQRSMFRVRIPAEAKSEARAKQEKTPPPSVSKSERSPRNTQKPPPPQRNTPSGILTKKMKKNCKIFAQFKNLCHLCSVRK